MAKVDPYRRVASVLCGDLDERAADVEACHSKASLACHLDRQVSRAGRDLEHVGSGREARGEQRSLFVVRVELAPRAADVGVPPRDRTLHLGAFEPPASRLRRVHLNSPYLTVLG